MFFLIFRWNSETGSCEYVPRSQKLIYEHPNHTRNALQISNHLIGDSSRVSQGKPRDDDYLPTD